MQIDKGMILDLIRQRGDSQQADQADQELPGQVDTDDPGHLDLLKRFGVDPSMLSGLLGKLGGGGSGGGLPGGLGKLLG